MRVKASKIVGIMEGWVGLDRANKSHAPIIDTYNNYTPLARGYKVTYKDAYCAATVSAAAITADCVDMLGGTECGVEEYIKLFKKKGIWEEDGTIVPEYGYIICYNWDQKAQPNDGAADHIGIVVSVDGDNVKVVEGNIKGKVGYRTIAIGDGYIRGYAIPDYLPEEEEEEKRIINHDEVIEISSFVSPSDETEVEGTLKIKAGFAYAFDKPDFSIRDRWYKIKDGSYVSAYLVEGWVKEPLNNSKWIDEKDCRWWYERLGHDYYKHCVANIDGKEYFFDKEGYLVMPGRLNDGGDVKYADKGNGEG